MLSSVTTAPRQKAGLRSGVLRGTTAMLGAMALAACSGANEQAGRERDKASAAARGEDYTGAGPNERIGEVKDRAAAADQKVRDTAAENLRAQGQDIERKADVEAAVFDEQSRAIRAEASKQSQTLSDQANTSRR